MQSQVTLLFVSQSLSTSSDIRDYYFPGLGSEEIIVDLTVGNRYIKIAFLAN